MANNINMLNAWTGDDSISRAELQAGVEAATVYDLARGNMKSDTRVVTSDTSAPGSSDGELWHNTNSLAGTGGPLKRLSFYNSGTSLWMDLAEIIYSATTPSQTEDGALWYDMTLHMLRVYRSASYDLNGIAGWHPVSEAYQLLKNESGGSIAANRCVIWYSGGSAENAITVASAEKDPYVAGVTMEAIASATYGVVATVAGGARVDLYVDEATHALVKGDGIITASANGYGRSVGPLASSSFSAATQSSLGTPYGCFARALGVTSSNLAPVKLLGYVGGGCHVTFSEAATFLDATPVVSGAFTNFFPLRSSTDSNGGQAATDDLLLSAKHGIPVSVDLQWSGALDSATTYFGVNVKFSKDGTNTERRQVIYRYSGSPLVSVLEYIQVALKSDGSLYYSFTPTATISVFTTWGFNVTGYTY